MRVQLIISFLQYFKKFYQESYNLISWHLNFQ